MELQRVLGRQTLQRLHPLPYHNKPATRSRTVSCESGVRKARNQERADPLPRIKFNLFKDLERRLPQSSASVELKATVVLCRKEFFDTAENSESTDQEDERSGKKVYLQLISNATDPSTGKPLRTAEAVIENWSCTEARKSKHIASTNLSQYEVMFEVTQDFGEPGALLVKNFHRHEFLLKNVTVRIANRKSVHFACESCVYNASERVFFSNEVYLPGETPAGLRELREKELAQIRGDGTGERKECDRVYDYDVYNDLGDADLDASLARPTLGNSDALPYPRRIRTGRHRSKTDPDAEARGEQWTNFYIPRDERYTMVRSESKEVDAIQSASRKLVPAIEALYSAQTEFQSVSEIAALFKTRPAPGIETILTYPTPKVIAVDEKAWTMDEEFAREMLAGLNPVVISQLREFPIKSADSTISAIARHHVEPFMEGVSVPEALAASRLFALDYHDAFRPFVSRINERAGCKAYATRTVLFLTREGTLRPVAIELCLDEESPRVFSPPEAGMKDWIWELAKAHVLANDAAFHQLISHWLRSHATMEPVCVATHRQLSAMHPVHQLLRPHFKNTLDINAAARKALINAGGIIEMTFTPHRYAMEISSAAYKRLWRFDEQALPKDLIQRGMAVPDATSPHGLRLTIEDYPFAADGLELWSAITSWVQEYLTLFYSTDAAVQSDAELQRWWHELRFTGHGDKLEGWIELNSVVNLVEIVTIIVWIASCHHAAVNFGQYEYAGFMPNHPTMTRRLIPRAGTAEFRELVRDPEAFYLSMVSSETQATVIVTTTEVLSTHSSHEEFLGQRGTVNWSSDEKILEAFGRFQERISEIEELIKARNAEKRLKNRYGHVQLPYELLYPSSDSGMTGRGVPNSTSI